MLMHIGEEVGHDLSYASSHLNLLSLCSSSSSSARILYSILQPIFNDIREVVVAPAYRNLRPVDFNVNETVDERWTRLEAVEGGEELETRIRELVQRITLVLMQRLNF
jgi:hypothetical protein